MSLSDSWTSLFEGVRIVSSRRIKSMQCLIYLPPIQRSPIACFVKHFDIFLNCIDVLQISIYIPNFVSEYVKIKNILFLCVMFLSNTQIHIFLCVNKSHIPD